MSLNSFNSDFLKPLIHKLGSENKQLILLGDFNVNLLNIPDDPESSIFLDTLGSSLILPQILLPTRITEGSQTLIDNIFSTVSDSQNISGNICFSISDHLPQFCIFNSRKCSSAGGVVNKQNWSKFDQDAFTSDFHEINWDSEFDKCDLDPNLCFNSFDSKMKALLDRHLPTIRLTKRQRKTQLKPWITPGIIRSIARRNFFHRKFIQAKCPETKSQFLTQFKAYRNLIVTLCRQSKSNYFTAYFNQHSTNMHKIWLGVKNLISLKSTKSQNPISISIGNSVSSDPEIVANGFNDFFSSIANSVRSTIPNTNYHFSNFLKSRNPNSIFLSPVTPEEVSMIIGSFSQSKSSGPHSIPVRVLKLLKLDISTPIASLINRSFEVGTFPSILKTSKVIPVYKNKGSPLNPSNYRPISLLSNIEKIFEKVMYSRLMGFLDDQNLIYVRQFGFRKHHSTTHALINIVEEMS